LYLLPNEAGFSPLEKQRKLKSLLADVHHHVLSIVFLGGFGCAMREEQVIA
jgi:hypothetical protein